MPENMATEAQKAVEQNLPVEENTVEQSSVKSNLTLQEETAFKETELMKLLSDKETLRTPAGRELLEQNLFSVLKEQFLMKPDDIRSAEYIKEFYEKNSCIYVDSRLLDYVIVRMRQEE